MLTIQTMRWLAPSDAASLNHDGVGTAEAVPTPHVVFVPGFAA